MCHMIRLLLLVTRCANPIFLLRCNCLISLACLYQMDGDGPGGKLKYPNIIQGHLANVYAFAEWAHEVFNCASQRDLSDLCANLESMCYLFERSIMLREIAGSLSEEEEDQAAATGGKDGQHTGHLDREVSLPDTVEERRWLKWRRNKFDETFESISLCDDSIKEVVMFNFGEPLSKSYGATACRLMMERARKILLVQPEVRDLTPPEMAKLTVANMFSAGGVLITFIDG